MEKYRLIVQNQKTKTVVREGEWEETPEALSARAKRINDHNFLVADELVARVEVSGQPGEETRYAY